MKFLFIFALILTASFPVLADTPISKEQANSYYQNCVTSAQSEQDLFQNAQQMFCACTAAHLEQSFSVEDMKTMTSETDPNARIAMNKMIVHVYAPCMEEPTRERYYNRCLKAEGAQQQICKCATDKLALHMKHNGSEIFSQILAQNPTVEDPWSLLEDDPAFNDFLEAATKECLK